VTILLVAAAIALVAWLGVLVSPHQPHRTRERLEADAGASADLSAVTVLIPARDEAALIAQTLAALRLQGDRLEVVVVDDQSTDGTAAVARAAADDSLDVRVVSGRALPEGWAGKLWALEQGLEAARRDFVLLLDADIELLPGLVPALLQKAREQSASLVSIMAELRCLSFWERLLTPAFVFFFKLLYPFSWSNDPQRRTAAAAGGCMLVRTDVLREIGGFAAIRAALIDDCTLAAAIKRARPPIWLGLSHSVRSLRPYPRLADFWEMVTRSAFTQLRYSALLLVVTAALMAVVLLAPVLAVLAGSSAGREGLSLVGTLAWLAMWAAYWPTIRFYGLSPLWALTLPFAALLFLAMTWHSALRYWRGSGASWKHRRYDKSFADRGRT
jgi:hopene-associated glycosyltransferase HpnB